MGRPVRMRTILDRKFTGTASAASSLWVESRLPGIRQISNPVKIFCVFPNPAPDPENTLPDLDLSVHFDKGFAFCRSILS